MRLVLFIGFFLLFSNSVYAQEKNFLQQRYYQALQDECQTQQSVSCCEASVDRMEKGGFQRDISGLTENYGCPPGYNANMLRCFSSYRWCEPVESKFKYQSDASFCLQDRDCALREAVCGPEPMNIYFDNKVFALMQPYVECAAPLEYDVPRCEENKCVAKVLRDPNVE